MKQNYHTYPFISLSTYRHFLWKF